MNLRETCAGVERYCSVRLRQQRRQAEPEQLEFGQR